MNALDIEEQVARIQRMQEETRKYIEEAHKLASEQRKIDRDFGLAPWQVAISGITAGAALMGAGVLLGRYLAGV